MSFCFCYNVQVQYVFGGYINGRGYGGGVNGFYCDFDIGLVFLYVNGILDDVLFIYSFVLGGVGFILVYFQMFFNFYLEQWFGLFGVNLVSCFGVKGCVCIVESVVGESVVNSEFMDVSVSVIGGKGVGQGGVSLGVGFSEVISLVCFILYSCSDCFKQYVESGGCSFGLGSGYGCCFDDDEKSVSIVFVS